jgi:hypothetical protein
MAPIPLIISVLLSCLSFVSALNVARREVPARSSLAISDTALGGPGPIFPNDDPFYKAPAGYESAKLGDILQYRKVPNPITMNNKDPISVRAAWQIQYRTQNSVGEPEANIVTLLVPFNPKPKHLFSLSFFSVRIMIRLGRFRC